MSKIIEIYEKIENYFAYDISPEMQFWLCVGVVGFFLGWFAYIIITADDYKSFGG